MLLCAAAISYGLLHFVRKERAAAYHLCLLCGRLEWREWQGKETLSTTVFDEHPAFLRRFGALLPPNHAHDWTIRGCICTDRGCALVESTGPVWIEVLPRLSDTAAAEALVRESVADSREQREELIRSFEGAFAGCGDRIDEAFARWQHQRGR